jgi:antitoxin ParD1/3/4
MQINLGGKKEEFINSLLATGRYTDVDDILNKALSLLFEYEEDYKKWEDEVRKKVDVAIAELERGEGLDGETVIAMLQEKLRKAREEKERQELLESANQAYTELRNNPELWQDELAERELWEQTLNDGLEE